MILYKSILLISFSITLQVALSLDDLHIESVIIYCQNKVKSLSATEVKYVKGPRLPGEPVLNGPPTVELLPIVYAIHQRQLVFECISDKLNGYSHEDLSASTGYSALVQECESQRPTSALCDPTYPYKLINGGCNNFLYPEWGRTLSCFRRLWPANYEGASGMRKSFQRERRLPLPRSVSLKIFKPRSRPTVNYNSLFAFFGQAVAHDMEELSFTTAVVVENFDCCKYAKTKEQHPQCAPILHGPKDPFYSDKNVSCLSFVRMAACHSCSVGKRNHINQVTSYIDCSLTYGQTDEIAMSLRRNDGSGKLLSQYVDAGELLPPVPDPEPDRCGNPLKQQHCFLGGDDRTNQHSLIMMFQTILLREHNRIADKLKNLNPDWDDEKLYQESRKILIAEFQVIVYREYLPVLLGPFLMSKYGLNIGYGSSYDFRIDPSISIEFNAAAFRVHTLIPGKVVPDEKFEYMKNLSINAAPLYENKTSSFLSKMSAFTAEKHDWYMPTDLTDYLYLETHGTYGFDLAAVDIQRGRDVGIPTYAQVIEYMEKRPGSIRTFDDLKSYTVPKCLKLLQESYHDVRDIDLWVGLNCERVPHGMIISPIAAEIIAEQFKRLKYGDRFYIEHDYTLSDDQRQTLLSASLAKMICDNSDVTIMQPMAMLFPSNKNVLQDCSTIPGVDLEKWREKK